MCRRYPALVAVAGLGLYQRLVAGAAGELGQGLAAVDVGVPRHVRRRGELRLGDDLDTERGNVGHAADPTARMLASPFDA